MRSTKPYWNQIVPFWTKNVRNQTNELHLTSFLSVFGVVLSTKSANDTELSEITFFSPFGKKERTREKQTVKQPRSNSKRHFTRFSYAIGQQISLPLYSDGAKFTLYILKLKKKLRDFKRAVTLLQYSYSNGSSRFWRGIKWRKSSKLRKNMKINRPITEPKVIHVP